jgi:hypothetical protein
MEFFYRKDQGMKVVVQPRTFAILASLIVVIIAPEVMPNWSSILRAVAGAF